MSSNANPERNYENAIKIINSHRRPARPGTSGSAIVSDTRTQDTSGTPDLRGVPSIVGMTRWLDSLGHSAADINNLNIIHIAGTKGKGSTCAFTESILRAHGRRAGFPRKTGMYTSPHLIEPEERIRINSVPLRKDLFAKYFFEVYDKLPQLSERYDQLQTPDERGPRNLQIFALLALHVFVREGVDAAIIETHHGGEYDATNFIQRPVVTAITSLGLDHVDQLGPGIQQIAWHKSGIFKQDSTCLSTFQEASAAEMISHRAREKAEFVRFVADDERLPKYALQLQVAVQRKNASLALVAAEEFLRRIALDTSGELKAEDIRQGIEQWSWPGRFQLIQDDQRTWFLDAAHNEMSVQIAAEWFAQAGTNLEATAGRILVFAHVSQNRDSIALLEALAQALRAHAADIQRVIFTTYDVSDSDATSEPASVNEGFSEVWRSFFPASEIVKKDTIQAAMESAKTSSRSADEVLHILVTGSQHLVGPALSILEYTHSMEKPSSQGCHHGLRPTSPAVGLFPETTTTQASSTVARGP